MALTENFNLLSLPESIEDAFVALQDNFYFLLAAVARGSLIVPGWDTQVTSLVSPTDFDHPDYMELTKTYDNESPNVTRRIRIEFTYSDTGSPVVARYPTTIVYKYDDGVSSPGLTTITGGTMTVVYDINGNVMSATSA